MAYAPDELLKLLINTRFQSFDSIDWQNYPNVLDANPRIAEIDDKTVVIDNDTVLIHSMDGLVERYTLDVVSE